MSAVVGFVDSPASEPEAAEIAKDVRRALARELHDSVAQTLTQLVVELEQFKSEQLGRRSVLERVDVFQERTRRALTELRELLYELREGPATRLDLARMIDESLAELKARTGVEVAAVFDGPDAGSVPAPAAMNLFRFVTAALDNIAFHSTARRVEVSLRPADEGWLELAVEDDGEAAAFGLGRQGFGLLGMRERVTLLGGEFGIDAAGAGVRVWARIPEAAVR